MKTLAALIAGVALLLTPMTAQAQQPVTQKQFQRLAAKVEHQKDRIDLLRTRVTKLEQRHRRLAAAHDELHDWAIERYNEFAGLHSTLVGTFNTLAAQVSCHIAQPEHGGAC